MINHAASVISRIIFWEPCVSPHKSHLLDEISLKLGATTEIICVADKALPSSRARMGWEIDSNEFRHRLIVGPSKENIKDMCTRTAPGLTLHVFSGIRWVPTIVTALSLIKRSKDPFMIMSEPRDSDGWRGKLRWAHSLASEAWIRNRVSGVLAIGRHGPPWFESVGYAKHKIYPFAYFLPTSSSDADEVIVEVPYNYRTLGYVGRITPSKGIAYLLHALSELGTRFRLQIIGAGEEDKILQALGSQLGINIEWIGVLPQSRIPEAMRGFDVLVLPSISKDDGWGAVVSEALMVGTPVVASHHVGASILLDETANGRVVPARNSKAIAQAINDLVNSGELHDECRRSRSWRTRQQLSAKFGAQYFCEILEHVFCAGERPKPFYQSRNKAFSG